ncbi:hypothetical protein FB446DRAFT_705026 [Lentinula raphanica]|nr:hypothetical protein FB446DRAFT_705026 [Lentinula raphanica]
MTLVENETYSSFVRGLYIGNGCQALLLVPIPVDTRITTWPNNSNCIQFVVQTHVPKELAQRGDTSTSTSTTLYRGSEGKDKLVPNDQVSIIEFPNDQEVEIGNQESNYSGTQSSRDGQRFGGCLWRLQRQSDFADVQMTPRNKEEGIGRADKPEKIARNLVARQHKEMNCTIETPLKSSGFPGFPEILKDFQRFSKKLRQPGPRYIFPDVGVVGKIRNSDSTRESVLVIKHSCNTFAEMEKSDWGLVKVILEWLVDNCHLYGNITPPPMTTPLILSPMPSLLDSPSCLGKSPDTLDINIHSPLFRIRNLRWNLFEHTGIISLFKMFSMCSALHKAFDPKLHTKFMKVLNRFEGKTGGSAAYSVADPFSTLAVNDINILVPCILGAFQGWKNSPPIEYKIGLNLGCTISKYLTVPCNFESQVSYSVPEEEVDKLQSRSTT